MANQLAIVTGASSGIGLSLFKELARRGDGLDVVPRRPFMRRETQRISSAFSNSRWHRQSVRKALHEKMANPQTKSKF